MSVDQSCHTALKRSSYTGFIFGSPAPDAPVRYITNSMIGHAWLAKESHWLRLDDEVPAQFSYLLHSCSHFGELRAGMHFECSKVENILRQMQRSTPSGLWYAMTALTGERHAHVPSLIVGRLSLIDSAGAGCRWHILEWQIKPCQRTPAAMGKEVRGFPCVTLSPGWTAHLPRRFPASRLHRVWGRSRSTSQLLTILDHLTLDATASSAPFFEFC
ncbi:hypothetical protein BKA63DRAFT_95981 [Paraphoma chrysanthemicola]|nr:hypothetical protein BKA63DRAFT_95981 [Paraphoma chrysanthemicola]